MTLLNQINQNISLGVEEIDDLYNGQSYSDYVNALAKAKSQKIVSNGLPEHARVIYTALLSNAEKEICIFSGRLRSDIYDEDSIISALIDFLSDEKRKIKIILQEIDLPGSDIFKKESLSDLNKLRRFIETCHTHSKSGQFDIRKCSDKDRTIKKHFAIMDEIGYRYCRDKDITEAIACFNDPETASHLKSQFNILFDRATQIAIPEISLKDQTAVGTQ